MDTRWLEDFLLLVETGHFTRAAHRRNLSQAAFSRRIKSLELWAGAELVDRSRSPVRVTAAGARLLQHAAGVTEQLVDARSEMSGRPVFARDQVRIALPYVISTADFAPWWQSWTREAPLACRLLHGNIHELSAALASGAADLMIRHEDADQPMPVDQSEIERVVLAADMLKPWFNARFAGPAAAGFPGSERQPVPLLMYPTGIYFARLVELCIASAPTRLHGVRHAESDMADVLHGLAMAGLGVAWLPESTVRARGSMLSPLGAGEWTRRLQIVAQRPKKRLSASAERLWEQMTLAARMDGKRMNAHRQTDARALPASRSPSSRTSQPKH